MPSNNREVMRFHASGTRFCAQIYTAPVTAIASTTPNYGHAVGEIEGTNS